MTAGECLSRLTPVCSSYYRRQFITTTQNTFNKPAPTLTSNQGIVSEQTKRQKHAAQQ